MFVVVNHTLTEEHPQDGQIPDSEEDEQENLKRGQRRLSPSLSPFGVEEWEEDQGRYRRSLSPSPDQVRALIARFALDYGPQGSGTSRCARKRKRSVSSASSLVVGPPSPASYGTLDNTKSRKRKRSVTWTSSQLDNPANQTKESTFKGLIIHKSRPQAMDFALEADRPPFRTKNTFRHIFWTDGSIIRQNAAGSVVWRSPPGFKSWDHRSFWVPFETPCTDLVEMFAISNALLLATYQVQESQSEVNSKNSQIEGGGQIQQPQLLHQVFVFTDSVGALTRIENEAQGRHSPAYCDEAHAIINYSSQLQSLGATLELHLVPGHSSVPGNERAHRVAKKAAQSLTESRGFSGPAERRHGPKPTDDQVLRPIKLADSQAISGKNSTPAIPHYDLQSIQDPALGSDDSTESISMRVKKFPRLCIIRQRSMTPPPPWIITKDQRPSYSPPYPCSQSTSVHGNTLPAGSPITLRPDRTPEPESVLSPEKASKTQSEVVSEPGSSSELKPIEHSLLDTPVVGRPEDTESAQLISIPLEPMVPFPWIRSFASSTPINAKVSALFDPLPDQLAVSNLAPASSLVLVDADRTIPIDARASREHSPLSGVTTEDILMSISSSSSGINVGISDYVVGIERK